MTLGRAEAGGGGSAESGTLGRASAGVDLEPELDVSPYPTAGAGQMLEARAEPAPGWIWSRSLDASRHRFAAQEKGEDEQLR